MPHRTVIVGGGIAGLVCAIRLQELGVPFHLLESSDRVGGRLKTDVVQGHRLDRGFQVFFEGYETPKRFLDYQALRLKPYPRGAKILYQKRWHTMDLDAPVATALSGFLPLADKLALWRLSLHLKSISADEVKAMDDTTAEQYVRAHGIGKMAIDRFLRPFFGGVFLDPSLQISARQFALIMRALQLGSVAIPELGMEEIPRQLAKKLPVGSLRTNAKVVSVSPSSATLDSGEEILCARLVVATDPRTTCWLMGLPIIPSTYSSTTLYFETPQPVAQDSYLRLNASGKGLVNEVALVSNVSEQCAPTGRSLLSATVIGVPDIEDEELTKQVAAEVAEWFDLSSVEQLSHLKTYRIRDAQLKQPPGWETLSVEKNGIFFAGEAVTNSSIEGAFESGLMAAERVYRSLKEKD